MGVKDGQKCFDNPVHWRGIWRTDIWWGVGSENPGLVRAVKFTCMELNTCSVLQSGGIEQSKPRINQHRQGKMEICLVHILKLQVSLRVRQEPICVDTSSGNHLCN